MDWSDLTQKRVGKAPVGSGGSGLTLVESRELRGRRTALRAELKTVGICWQSLRGKGH
ncbi:hypothetical protein Csa_018350, partial [Cucumis sativus]